MRRWPLEILIVFPSSASVLAGGANAAVAATFGAAFGAAAGGGAELSPGVELGASRIIRERPFASIGNFDDGTSREKGQEKLVRPLAEASKGAWRLGSC